LRQPAAAPVGCGAKRPPDAKHPLGTAARCTSSFIVALLLFTGGVFSIYEGVHVDDPERVGDIKAR
jgi:hypothetical protein